MHPAELEVSETVQFQTVQFLGSEALFLQAEAPELNYLRYPTLSLTKRYLTVSYTVHCVVGLDVFIRGKSSISDNIRDSPLPLHMVHPPHHLSTPRHQIFIMLSFQTRHVF